MSLVTNVSPNAPNVASLQNYNALGIETQSKGMELSILNGIPPPNSPSPSFVPPNTKTVQSGVSVAFMTSTQRGDEENIQIKIPQNIRTTTNPSSPIYMSPQREIPAPTTPSPATAPQRTDNPSFNATVSSASQSVLNMFKGKSEVLVGTPIKPDHVNYVLMYDMLTGIRIAVSRSMARPWREVVDADYETAHKLAFDITGDELNPSSKYDFKFKDYAPWVFRGIRRASNIDATEYLVSLTGRYVLSELGSPGKSGSFFYFSADYRYIIKTLYPKDKDSLLKILPNYYKHLQANPETLINRILGLHRVKLPGGDKIHFVVMENIFPPQLDVHETFDLKGSTYGRRLDPEKLKKNPRYTQKDLNWIEAGKKVWLGPIKSQVFLSQIDSDVAFLTANRIMDYSLLIGIHDLKRGNFDKIRDTTLSVFDPTQATPPLGSATAMRWAVATADPVSLGPSPFGLPEDIPRDRKARYFSQDNGGLLATSFTNEPLTELYFFGVIDVLTIYTPQKRMETFVKSFYQDGKAISAVDPVYYGKRFVEFVRGCIGKTPAPAALKFPAVWPSAVSMQAVSNIPASNIPMNAK